MPLALLLMAAMFLALLSLPRFSWPMTEGQVDAAPHGQNGTQREIQPKCHACVNTKPKARDTSVNACVCFLQDEMSYSYRAFGGKRQRNGADEQRDGSDTALGHTIVSVCVCV